MVTEGLRRRGINNKNDAMVEEKEIKREIFHAKLPEKVVQHTL